jgi:hypothetical protein
VSRKEDEMATREEGVSTETITPVSGVDGQRSLIDLARVAIEDLIRLIQQEIQLAKVEAKELLIRNGLAAGLLAGGAICLFVAFILGLVTLGLAFRQHQVLAIGIEAIVFLVLTIVLVLIGLRLLKIGPPEKTMTSLKEDAEWARQLLKRNGK